MTVSASAPLLDWDLARPARAEAAPSQITRAETTSLAQLQPGTVGAVVDVALDADLAGWLEAIGIGRGDRVEVLRRAAFGGPIHLRTHTGGEFAVDRALARCIRVEASAAGEEKKGAA